MSLSRKPQAPARRASWTYLVEVERRQDDDLRCRGASGSAVIRRVASRPSIIGIRTSMSTTSGRVRGGESQGLGAVVGLTDDLDVVGAGEQSR